MEKKAKLQKTAIKFNLKGRIKRFLDPKPGERISLPDTLKNFFVVESPRVKLLNRASRKAADKGFMLNQLANTIINRNPDKMGLKTGFKIMDEAKRKYDQSSFFKSRAKYMPHEKKPNWKNISLTGAGVGVAGGGTYALLKKKNKEEENA